MCQVTFIPHITWAYNIKQAVQIRLKDCDAQNWHAELYENSQCTFYRMIKDQLSIDKHVTLLSDKELIVYNRFICRNHQLPIAKIRFQDHAVDPSSHDRAARCHLCNLGDVGDEFHYLLKCTHFENERSTYLGQKCFRNANVYTVQRALKPSTRSKAKKLIQFIMYIGKYFK